MRSRSFLVLLLLVPSAGACSLAYTPFQQATHEGLLRYVDGEQLLEVEGLAEQVIEEGYFLSYAVRADRVVVAGQEGLGADCSGRAWLRIYDAGTLVDEWTADRDKRYRVHGHAEGAVVTSDKVTLLPWDGGVARHLGPAPANYVHAWGPDLMPVHEAVRDDAFVLVAGGRTFGLDPGESLLAAGADADAVAALVSQDGKARLMIVGDGPAEVWRWRHGEGWGADVEAYLGWAVVVGGRAYHVTDEVLDLGVEGAVSLGVDGDDLLVFTEAGYTRFRDGEPISAHRRADGLWIPEGSAPEGRPVPATRGQEPGHPPEEQTTLPLWPLLLALGGGLLAHKRLK